jgi:hypothetical protein
MKVAISFHAAESALDCYELVGRNRLSLDSFSPEMFSLVGAALSCSRLRKRLVEDDFCFENDVVLQCVSCCNPHENYFIICSNEQISCYNLIFG